MSATLEANVTHEATQKPTFESGVKFQDPEQQVGAMTSLIGEAAAWSARNGASYKTEVGPQGGTVETHDGMKFTDFQRFVARNNPGMAPRDVDSWAAGIENDAIRHKYNLPLEPGVNPLDKISHTATIDPTSVMKYGVHMIKETGMPFEGTALEAQVGSAVDAHIVALGGNPQSPDAAAQREAVLGIQ